MTDQCNEPVRTRVTSHMGRGRHVWLCCLKCWHVSQRQAIECERRTHAVRCDVCGDRVPESMTIVLADGLACDTCFERGQEDYD